MDESPIKLAAHCVTSRDLNFSPAACLRSALALVLLLAGATAPLLAEPPAGSKPRVTLDEFFNSVEFGG